MARARNLQVLTDAIKRRWPGVVVYGIGDAAHRLRASDHNEDDTAGSRAAQTDADTRPEHRAIDVMIGPAFARADANALVAALVADATARRRLFYIIFDGRIWSRSNGWARRAFDGDPHRDHVHISGWAADDENAAGWPAVDNIGGDVSAQDVADAFEAGGNRTGEVGRAVDSGFDAMFSRLSRNNPIMLHLIKTANETRAAVTAVQAAMLNVDEKVLAELGTAELTPEQKAAILRPLLGDDAITVGALLADTGQAG